MAPSAERGLLVVGGDGGHHLAGDRADDRQDHDREDQPGDEDVGDRDDAPADERDEREAVGDPLLGGHELGGEEEDAPQPVHDRGHGREQLDQDGDGRAHAPGAQLGDVDRGGDRDRHADQERQTGGDQRPDDERQRAELFGGDVPVVVEGEAEDAELGERRLRFAGEAEEEVDDQRQDQRRERGQAVAQCPIGKARDRRAPENRAPAGRRAMLPP